jgi:hypothetical protein
MQVSGIDLTFAHAVAHATVPPVSTFFRVDTAPFTFPYSHIALTFAYSFFFHFYAPSGCLPADINVYSLPQFHLQLIECPEVLPTSLPGCRDYDG